MQTFAVKSPLPRYRACAALRQELIDHLLGGRFSVGDPFLSDREVMAATGRSRTTVRRALVQLQREGWIERRGGVGTFVGPRIVMADSQREASSDRASGLVRLAAVVAGLGRLRHDWYTGGILNGMDEASVDNPLTVELLGDHHTRHGVLARRLLQSRPDVFACLGPPLAHASVIGEAGRLGIPCVLAGVRAPEVGLPNVFEDSVAASAMAVEHLVRQGHRMHLVGRGIRGAAARRAVRGGGSSS